MQGGAAPAFYAEFACYDQLVTLKLTHDFAQLQFAVILVKIYNIIISNEMKQMNQTNRVSFCDFNLAARQSVIASFLISWKEDSKKWQDHLHY